MHKKQRKQNKMSNILQGLNKTQAHDGAFLLTESRTYKLWESAGQKISEAQLTADQINQIFKQVEQGATAAGGNRTMLGKGKDVAGAVNKAWEDLKTKVQDSGPIKGVDAMYDSAAEKLKQATGGDEGVMKYVQKYRDFAKKHPVAQGLIYSALIAAAGISGAGVGGAAALGLFKMVDKLLQGEKFSSATYQGAKTGAMAYGASKLADYVKGKPEGGAGGGGTGSGEVPADIQKGLAADQAFQDSMLNKFPPDKGYTFGASGDSLEVFDSTGKKVFTGDIPLKTMDMKQFADLTNNGQMATPGISSGSMSSDPMAGVSDAAGKRGNSGWDSMKGNTNLDGSPMTLDQINQAKANLRAGNMTDMSGPADAPSNLASNIPPETIEQPTIKVRGQPVDVPGGMSGVGALDPSIAPIGANGEPMRAVPIDEPVTGRTGRMPGATQPGINRLTGKPFELAPSWDQMTPDQQAAVTARQLQQAADAAQGAENAKQYWANKPANTRGLKESFAEFNNESTILSESQIFLIIGKIVERQRKLDEGIMDTVKGAAGKAMNWAQTKGTNLTTKVTADKLLQAWKKAGSPTDSLDVASIIQKAGVPSDSIKQVYTTMQIPFAGEKGAGASTKRNIDVDPSSVAPAAPTSTPTASAPSATANAPAADASQPAPAATGSLAQVQELIAKLDPETKTKLISTLKQELSVAESRINELSNEKLGQYKKAASADATAADKAGDYKRGDKRFSGIVKATKKQFANDEKKSVAEAGMPFRGVGGAFNRGDDERHDLDPSEWYVVKDGKMFKTTVYPNQEQQAISLGYSRTRDEAKLKASKQGVSEEQLDELNCWSGYHRVAGTKAGFPGSCAKNKTNESEHKCPHCGGEMVSEELMNEKKDACYYKVKSRYKVWPSAYASGALVKCRKSGADSWGNGGKKNEGSILEGINRADESLHDWFNKEKWVRMDTKGKIKGPCAREPGEGKPKCLPQAKAHSLGKKGRASAAARKRREDPNPERSGKAINVNTKKKD
jgi:hypothetical protein